ncbi:MAG: serine/threonine-protein kinase RsbT [Clostridia bacterium]|jgi:anti-sigma regulatory factor (Ser/Thr protein kinase)|nr:serine/threonine-protein kinase RsbT [Clostridia bacterium]MDN5322635.1 serine/threonine-protein kinase RsbT [Clostridia bacterium]
METANNNLTMEFTITAGDFSTAGKAASEVKRILGQIGFPPAIIRRVAVATYEAEMNIVIHSFGGKITLFITPRKINILCEDNGPGIADIDLAMQEGFSTAPDKIRELGFGAGMGLPNIKRCSDEFKIYSEVGKGTKLEISIKLVE